MPNSSIKRYAPPIMAATAGTCVVLLSAGCMSLERMAPPVDERFIAIAGRGAEPTTLEMGRQVYLRDCARCHSVEPIERYSAEHWRKILPKMAEKSYLDDRRTAAVEAYVLAAHSVLARRAETDSQ